MKQNTLLIKSGSLLQERYSKELAPGLLLYTSVHKNGENDIELRYTLKNTPANKSSRTVEFHLKFFENENVLITSNNLLSSSPTRRSHHPGGGGAGNEEKKNGMDISSVKKTVQASSENTVLACLKVVDKGSPWKVEARYTWIEKRVTEKVLTENIVMRVVDRLAQSRQLVAVEYCLVFRTPEKSRIIFDIDFNKCENMELSSGGLKKRTIIPANAATPVLVAYLQVIDLTKAWTLNCKYDWCEEHSSLGVAIEKEETQEIAPGVFLITSRVTHGSIKAFRYQVKCSKDSELDFVLDSSLCENIKAKSSGQKRSKATVHAGETKEIETLQVADPSKSWKVKVKFSWNERNINLQSLKQNQANSVENFIPAKSIMPQANTEVCTVSTQHIQSRQIPDVSPKGQVSTLGSPQEYKQPTQVSTLSTQVSTL